MPAYSRLNSSQDKEPIFIVGPTCSGKSSLALELAEEIGGELVNADAYQIYEGLDRLTAKPSAEEFAAVPHHLYGAVPIEQDCQAGRFQEMAGEQIQEIQAERQRELSEALAAGEDARMELLNSVLQDVYAEAVKTRAGQLGDVLEVVEGESAEGNYELTIRVSV